MKRKENMPSWAYWGLWGINSRRVAMGFAVVTTLISIALVPIGIMANDYVLFAFALIPIWYCLSLKWADNNSAWLISEK